MIVEGMLEVTLPWFNPEDGYGYITPDDGGEEPFFSLSATRGGGFRNLEKGERVTYRVVEGWNGPQAEKVCKLQARKAPGFTFGGRRGAGRGRDVGGRFSQPTTTGTRWTALTP